MKNTHYSRYGCLIAIGLAVFTLLGCDPKKKDGTAQGEFRQVESELQSLGILSSDVLVFNLQCKSHDSKLYWILEVRQRVLGIAGVGGGSGPDAEKMAHRILAAFQATQVADSKSPAGSNLENKIKIEFIDKNGFKIAETTTNEISDIDPEGEHVEPSVYGWYYRGVIDLGSSDILRIADYQVRGDFSEGMNTLLQEATVLVKKR